MSYLGRPPSVPAGTRVIYEFLATEGQTVFTGEDEYGKILSYDPGYVNIFVNGKIMSGLDFDALDGENVTIKAPLPKDTVVQVEAFGTFAIADVYPKIDIDNALNKKIDKQLKKLTDFSIQNESGMYYANGDGTADPVLNGPAGTGNNVLTIHVKTVGALTHYTIIQNSGTQPRIFIGNLNVNTGSPVLTWDRPVGIYEFAAVKSGNGCQKFPSGLICQWGYTTMLGTTVSAVTTLPVAFTTAALVGVCSDAGGACMPSGIALTSLTQITVFCGTYYVASNGTVAQKNSNVGIRWIVWGY
ncbi:tail fiber protein [Yersinia phage vB_Yru_GN1]|uniref:Tail fiber protein n=1 Tax=Yersinia phage vB_Yru_GN1 TaxID=3074381 RepID=A0AA86M7P3_9CAUD|nr:tail fiber protein [Yersinia phage vB_Yru_GN1]